MIRKISSKYKVEQIPIITAAEHKVKSEVNNVSTNKRCRFLENIVCINERAERNWNGCCDVDFLFTLDQWNASFICGVMVIFSITNLYLFLKCVPSGLKSLSSLWCDTCSVCYPLCSNMQSYRSGQWCRKCKQWGTTSVGLVEIYTTLMKQIQFLRSD